MPNTLNPNDFISIEYFGNIWDFITNLHEFSKDAIGIFDYCIDSLPVYLIYVCTFYPFYKVNGEIGASAETIVNALGFVLGVNPHEIYDFITLCINRQDGYLKYDFRRHKEWRNEFPLITELF